ncbi:MAG: HAMP domain-containing sensor histidine kinase [Anaerolineae bacterium]|nr:HAMP domain-containing sensor histidine kinase [Anaerolineae bacterium]MDQ7036632.1 HAMP domain-containing sensor histidine kinase [Anaerolineae bacterium]
MFSNMTLRTRLFYSYLFLLAVSLAVVTGVLLLFLSSQPAPPHLTWQRLEAVLPALTQDIVDAARTRNNAAQGDLLNSFASTNEVRVLMLALDNNQARVLHDSSGDFAAQDRLQLRLEANYRAQRISIRAPNIEIGFGEFRNPDDSEWLYGGFYQRPIRGVRDNVDSIALIVAEPRNTKSAQAVLGEFGNSFLVPLVQASLVGGIVAFILAFLIARSIAQPLQKLSQAASSVAKGEYGEYVPETGPKEMRLVAESFNRMSAEVRAAQESQRDFMANVSHDLKTPLTSIQGYSQAIIDGAAKDPTQAAAIIHDEAARLNRMVTELTDLARLQVGRLSMKMQPLAVHEIVEAIAYRLAVVARQKNISLTVEANKLPIIAGDGDRLVQVFTNLVSNAIKYTPDGGQVWVSTQVRNGGVEIIVRDNGIGIPEQDLPRLFERFYQVDKSRGPQRGTGLGLAITKEIMDAHGGTINITSGGENMGTTVTIWLPAPQLTTYTPTPV